MGFTDHDQVLFVEGIKFSPQTGLTASEIKGSLGLATDNLEVFGALSSFRIKESDIQAGRYDDAEIEIWRVDWEEPTLFVQMIKGNLGEVRRGPIGFEAEVRGLSARLNQPVGQQYLPTCGAVLGDAKCGIDLTDAAHAGTGAISTLENERIFTASGLSGFSDAVFTFGLLTFTSGTNSGRRFDVRSHSSLGGVVSLELWDRPPDQIAVFDTFTLTAGCDKQLVTCGVRFSNINNFRGHAVLMPGDATMTQIAKRKNANSGGSRHGRGDGGDVYFEE